jgi:hypothetical protein
MHAMVEAAEKELSISQGKKRSGLQSKKSSGLQA